MYNDVLEQVGEDLIWFCGSWGIGCEEGWFLGG
jgi:hypothetical protein